MVHKLLKNIIHFLYPPRCPLCDGLLFASLAVPAKLICDGCRGKAEYVKEPACMKCGQPLEDGTWEYCYDCRHSQRSFEQGKALWVYKTDVKDSLYRFKYQNRREYAAYYGIELARAYGGWIQSCQIQAIVPIPLSKARLKKRGFNQAAAAARSLGRQMGIPVYEGVLLRIRDTDVQKSLNHKERKNNLKRAFKTGRNKVQLDCILLIDDIYTTGSTMHEAAAELKRSGVKQVYCLSISIGKGF
ncbi:ComF family protein [Lachnospiraceae bacterium 29-84]